MEEKEKMKMNKMIFGIGMVFAVLMVLTVSAATASEVNFVPDPSSALAGETTNVSIWLDSTEGVFSFDAELHFDPAVVNITDASVGDFPIGFGMGHYGNYVILGGVTSDCNDKTAGHWLLANLTLEAKNAGTSPLNFNPSKTYPGNQTGKRVPATWNNGTFTVLEPDLVVEEKSEEWINLAAKTYNVTYTVKNNGTAGAGASTTSIKIDGTEQATDSVPGLAAGASYTSTVGPFTMSGESDTILVCADKDNAVEESNETNNCLENEFTYQGRLDLVAEEKSEVRVSLAEKTYNVTYTVKNNGTAEAGASTTSIKIDGTEEATDSVPGLAAGASYTNTVGPFTMSGESDTIRVCADKDNAVEESNETNNCLENEFEYLGMPDLVVEEKSEEWVSLADKTYNVTYTVKNIGGAKANASITCIYIDGINGKNDNVGELLAGASYTNTVGPFTMSGDNDTINVCADCEGNVTEIDENNNCTENIFKYLKPDLVITGKLEEWVNFDEKTYNVTYTVKNIGEGPACASNTSIKIDGVEKATDSVPELAAGASYTSTVGPFTMSGNKDTISVCTDKDNVVNESNEANNCMENEWIYNTETATGSGTAYFDSDTGTMEGLTAIPEATLPGEGKPNLVFPHGFFSFNITGLTPGQVVNVTITLPGSVAGMEYWKYGPTPDNHTEHWYKFMYDGQTGAEINGNVVILHFIDGQRGDDNLTANGVIVDQGGSGNPPKAPPVAVPEYNIFGLLGLIGLLSVVLVVTIGGRGRKR
ncbi:MAG TPA: hypothetical protein C5S37_12145 [Methanophagales archaeon]|nr:hypothetical protein [Methanophagales archaeon]